MAAQCTDRERLAGWCQGVAGETFEERRSELFWQYISGRQQTPEIEQHLEACQDCRQAMERERALAGARRSQGTVQVAVCPSSDEMLRYLERGEGMSPWRRLEIKRHVEQCALCREEAGWAASVVVEPRKAPRLGWFGWKWTWGVAAAATAAMVVFFAVVNPPGPRRLARYALVPDVPYEAMRAEFTQKHPEDQMQFRAATELVSIGEYRQGEQMLQALQQKCGADPSVVFFLGHVALREGRIPEAVILCTRAEKSSLNGYRCWYLANLALIAGDVDLARKEIQHATHHEPYAGPAKRLEQLVH